MRLMCFKLPTAVKTLMADLASRFSFKDAGFVEDIYCIVSTAGNKLPTPDKIKVMAADIAKSNPGMSSVVVQMLLNKRRQVLHRLATMPFFPDLCDIEDRTSAVERLLIHFNTLYFKMREAQCLSCQYLNQCAFGQQYSKMVTDIRAANVVRQPNNALQPHKDCPYLPEMDAMNAISNAMDQYSKLLNAEAEGKDDDATQIVRESLKKSGLGDSGDEMSELSEYSKDAAYAQQTSLPDDDAGTTNPDDGMDVPSMSPNVGNGDGCGRSKGYRTAHSADDLFIKSEKLVQSLTSANLALYQVARNLTQGLLSKTGSSTESTQVQAKHHKERSVKNAKDLSHLVRSENALPEDVFNAKFDNKTLRAVDQRTTRKHLLYLLLDSSGSMGSALPAASKLLQAMTRGTLASLFASAMVRRIQNEGGYVYLRFFEGSPDALRTATSSQGFDDMFALIMRCHFNGGGTDINAALKQAVHDIGVGGSQISRAEILLVTDCEDSLDGNVIKQMLGNIKLHVLDLSGKPDKNAALAKVCPKYFKVDAQCQSLDGAVKLLPFTN